MATRRTHTAAKPAAAPAPRKSPTRKAPAKAARPTAKAPTRPARKPSGQPAAKPAAPAAADVHAKPAVAAKDKADKSRKAKMVRDSFTMPKAEYASIDALKARAAQAGRPTKKSELLRSGVRLLESLGDAALLAALDALPAIKTGRPAKG